MSAQARRDSDQVNGRAPLKSGECPAKKSASRQKRRIKPLDYGRWRFAPRPCDSAEVRLPQASKTGIGALGLMFLQKIEKNIAEGNFFVLTCDHMRYLFHHDPRAVGQPLLQRHRCARTGNNVLSCM